MATFERKTTKAGEVRYRVKIRVKGSPHQDQTFHKLSNAKIWAAKTETEVRDGRHFKTKEEKNRTLGDLIDRYFLEIFPHKPKDKQQRANQLMFWKKQLGHSLLTNISAPMITEKRDELLRGTTSRGTRRSSSTVMKYLFTLSHVFTIAIKEWGWLEKSPMRKMTGLRLPRGRMRYLEEPEKERLLRECKESSNPHLYSIVILAISTGMRFGEIINLKWTDVDLDRKRIILQETKNGDRRSVPIAGLALNQLTQLLKIRHLDTDLLFPKIRRREGSLQLQSVDKVQKVQKPIQIRIPWLAALKKAKIPDFRFHDLRHCAASYLAMSGASLIEIADILGLKTLSMVKRYSHLSASHQHAVVDRMNLQFLG